jgi:hypothetical protein
MHLVPDRSGPAAVAGMGEAAARRVNGRGDRATGRERWQKEENSMTSLDDFRRSLADAAPPEGADLALQALWWAGKGDWDRAHGCAQQREGEPGCDWVHAHLHRREGDLANAGYWYRRAGRKMAGASLAEEWDAIAAALLSR